MDEEVWFYGLDEVTFAISTSKVIKWDNSSDGLQVEVVPGVHVTESETFAFGSHKADVARLQGTPTRVERLDVLDEEVWFYGLDEVTFAISTSKVIKWDNSSGGLQVEVVPGVHMTESEALAFGSHKADVARLQGTPTRVDIWSVLGEEIWFYGWSSITFDMATDLVVKWNNSDGNLSVELDPGPSVTSSNSFTFGSSKHDVILLQRTLQRELEYAIVQKSSRV